MTDKTNDEEMVKNPENLLRMYRELQADVTTLRTENKELKNKVEAADEAAVEKWKSRAVKAEAKQRLETEGVRNAERILKYMKLEGIDFDDDDKLSGFDEKFEEVKTDFPELFDKKRRVGGGADIHADGKVENEKSLTEQQVAGWFS